MVTESFSEQLRQEAEPIWEEIFHNPFLQEISDAALPLEKFRYYLTQDYLYLEGFARAVALALAKAPDAASLESLAHRVLTPVERPLHHRLMEAAGLRIEQLQAAKTLTHQPSLHQPHGAHGIRRGVGGHRSCPAPLPVDLSPAGRVVVPHGTPRVQPVDLLLHRGRLGKQRGGVALLRRHRSRPSRPTRAGSPCAEPSSQAAATSGCSGAWHIRWRLGRSRANSHCERGCRLFSAVCPTEFVQSSRLIC